MGSRRLAIGSFACAIATTTACSLLVDTSGLSGDSTPGAAADAASDGTSLDAAAIDAGTDAPPAVACDVSKPFGALTAFPQPVNSKSNEYAGALSPDMLTIWVASDRSDPGDIFVFTRPDLAGAWSSGPSLSGINSPSGDSDVFVSPDQLTILFDSSRGVGPAGDNIFMATRPNVTTSFGAPTLVLAVASDADDKEPWLTASGDLYFASTRPGPGGLDLYVSKRVGGGLGPPSLIAPLNTASDDEGPVLTADELTLFFASDRGSAGNKEVWVARRASVSAAFGAPQLVPELNTSASDYPTWVSADGCSIVVESYKDGDANLYFASRPK